MKKIIFAFATLLAVVACTTKPTEATVGNNNATGEFSLLRIWLQRLVL